MKKIPIFLGMMATLAVLLLHSLFLPSIPAEAERTVIDNERGFIYVSPYDGDWSKVGAYIGLAHYDTFAAMNSEAIKGIHGRFQHFHPLDEKGGYSYFPYSSLKQYEAEELAQDRAPIWITATYQGQKKSVLFKWFWQGSKIQAQAVNIADERYINFFIKNYVRQKLRQKNNQNLWVGLDSCAFDYNLYGVLDDSGNYIENLTWDRPFPQNNREFLQAVQYFFKRLKELAPDIKTICNEGSIADESQYGEVFANTDGAIIEDFLGDIYNSDGENVRLKTYRLYLRMKNFAAHKVQIYQPNTHSQDELIRRMYLAYIIFGGENRFFSAKDDQTVEIDPHRYAEMKNALGNPSEPAKDEQELGKDEGYRLYSRQCEGGIAFLNLTGKTKTIALNSHQKYFDEQGNPIAKIAIQDKDARYVLFSPGIRTEKPAINPRRSDIVAGSLAVTLNTTPSDTIIRYTLDGSEPNENSAVYNRPITLTQSTTIKAKAFRANERESFVSTASYRITNELPTVEFHLSADRGSRFLTNDYPLVELSHVSAQPVTVNYSATGGTATAGVDYKLVAGTLTFMPGEKYRYFPVEIINHNQAIARTIEITLSHPNRAKLGVKKLYIYTIAGN